MGRAISISAVLFVVALSIGLVLENPRYVFAVASLAIFGFLVIGFLLFPRLNPGVPLRFPAASEPEQYEEKLLVAGLQVSPSGFPQQFACVLEPRSWWLLLLLGVLSLGAFCLLVSKIPLIHFVEGHFFEGIYVPGLLTLAGLSISIKWYSEQSLLANSAATLGIVSGINEFGQYRKIRYEFRDAEGGYYGGTERDFVSRQMDQIVLVVYDRRNPDHSCSSRGFMFRSVKMYPNVKVAQN
jgi:hypothetical protein